jgi:CheY-like chemotaxis protein
MGSNVLAEGASECVEKPTVLVVEDEILIRVVASDELREHGYTVIEAATADEALSVLSGPTRVDLVITDIKMPGTVDGIALARHIRAAFPFIKIVVVSGQVAGPDVRAMVDGYLSKPVAPSRLASFVHALVPPNLPTESA